MKMKIRKINNTGKVEIISVAEAEKMVKHNDWYFSSFNQDEIREGRKKKINELEKEVNNKGS